MAFPWLPVALGLLSAGKGLGTAAKGAADERQQENLSTQTANQAALTQYQIQQRALLDALMAMDRGETDRYQTRQGATTSALANQSTENILRARLGLEAPAERARQSILGSLMQNMQPVTVSGGNERVRANMPVFSGGLTAAALDPVTRQHGGELMQAALNAQRTGSDVPAATDFMGGVLEAPARTDYMKGILNAPAMGGYKKAGKGESWLSGGAILADIFGSALGAKAMGDAGQTFSPTERGYAAMAQFQNMNKEMPLNFRNFLFRPPPRVNLTPPWPSSWINY